MRAKPVLCEWARCSRTQRDTAPHPLPARRRGACRRVYNRFTLAGLAFVGLSMLGSLLFVGDLLFGGLVMFATVAVAAVTMVVCWCVAPLLRRRRVQRAIAMPRRSPDRTARSRG